MIRYACGDKPKQWDAAIPQIEFAFNSIPNRLTKKSPFDVVYTHSPRHTLNLVELPSIPGVSQAAEELAEKIHKVHVEVTQNLEAANQRYKVAADQHGRLKVFHEGDPVMVFSRKGRFPVGSYHNLKNKKIGPCRILKKISDNAYVVDPPANLGISNTFNIADLYDYYPPDELELSTSNSRTSSVLSGGD